MSYPLRRKKMTEALASDREKVLLDELASKEKALSAKEEELRRQADEIERLEETTTLWESYRALARQERVRARRNPRTAESEEFLTMENTMVFDLVAAGLSQRKVLAVLGPVAFDVALSAQLA